MIRQRGCLGPKPAKDIGRGIRMTVWFFWVNTFFTGIGSYFVTVPREFNIVASEAVPKLYCLWPRQQKKKRVLRRSVLLDGLGNFNLIVSKELLINDCGIIFGRYRGIISTQTLNKTFYRGLDRNLIIMGLWDHFYTTLEFEEQHFYR